MNVALRGSSPATIVAGILLLARARSFGQRISVEIVGDPGDIGIVPGPAILHSAALASCGVGRELGQGALVIVPGSASDPLAVSLSPDGRQDWFFVDRTGAGFHPATRAFVRMRRDGRPIVRNHVRQFMRAMNSLGCASEPAILDVLFGAPAPPLTRLAVALRAGRSMTGMRGGPITGFFVGDVDDGASTVALGDAIARLAPAFRGPVESWVAAAERFAAEDDDRAFIDALSEIGAHLALLPPNSILPPLVPAADAVAFGLGRALGASQGNPEGQAALLETYRFLGGRFVASANHPVDLPADAPPVDRLGRWSWLSTHVALAAEQVERIWRNLMDPLQ